MLTHCGLRGLYLAEYVSKLISKFGCNLNEILFSYLEINLKLSSGKWRPYCLGLNVLTHCCRGKVGFYFADDILISFFFSIWVTFAYVIFMNWIWVRRMQKNRPYCLCQYVLTRYDRDKMTFILKMTFSISFSTLDEIWYKKVTLK